MKLKKIGIIAEIIGTTAIVVTRVLLLHESRQNAAASYASSWDAITESQIEWRMDRLPNLPLIAAEILELVQRIFVACFDAERLASLAALDLATNDFRAR